MLLAMIMDAADAEVPNIRGDCSSLQNALRTCSAAGPDHWCAISASYPVVTPDVADPEVPSRHGNCSPRCCGVLWGCQNRSLALQLPQKLPRQLQAEQPGLKCSASSSKRTPRYASVVPTNFNELLQGHAQATQLSLPCLLCRHHCPSA